MWMFVSLSIFCASSAAVNGLLLSETLIKGEVGAVRSSLASPSQRSLPQREGGNFAMCSLCICFFFLQDKYASS